MSFQNERRRKRKKEKKKEGKSNRVDIAWVTLVLAILKNGFPFKKLISARPTLAGDSTKDAARVKRQERVELAVVPVHFGISLSCSHAETPITALSYSAAVVCCVRADALPKFLVPFPSCLPRVAKGFLTPPDLGTLIVQSRGFVPLNHKKKKQTVGLELCNPSTDCWGSKLIRHLLSKQKKNQIERGRNKQNTEAEALID